MIRLLGVLLRSAAAAPKDPTVFPVGAEKSADIAKTEPRMDDLAASAYPTDPPPFPRNQD